MPAPDIVSPVIAELTRALLKFPQWPTDPIHALAVVQEELGELNCAAGKLAKEVLQLSYEPEKSSLESVRAEATQTVAMAIRFLNSVSRYEFKPGPQHSQDTAAQSSADQSDGWIKHDGKAVPELDGQIEFECRDGYKDKVFGVGIWNGEENFWLWDTCNVNDQIIRYRFAE